jgi:carboxyl-terminal processing protease
VHRFFRAGLAAVSIAVVSLTGAVLLTRASADRFSPSLVQRDDAPADLRMLLGGSPHSDERLLDTAFAKVEDTYYKPVAAQLMLDGERKELLTDIKSHGVAHPSLPRFTATGDRSHDRSLLDQNLSAAQTAYAQKVPGSELREAALRGMLAALGDPYTTYLSATEISRLEESLRGGDFGGIGVYIVQDPNTKQILVDPITGTPAYKAGIKPGDEIVSVNGASTRALPLDNIERLIRGPVGTQVVLVLRTHDSAKNRTVAVTRGHIQVPSVLAKMEDGFEYVRLSDFGQTSYDEVRHAMLDGKTHHARGYILDLRDNGGGLLEAAVQISSLFIPEGTIVSTIDRAGTRDVREADHDSIGTAPLVLLVNKYTASASEITASAVQDYKAGTLIGTRTFGKGVVQSIYSLGPQSGALKITTARYVTPLGRDIHHKGIKPDIVVDQPIEAGIIDSPKDAQLLAAKAYLRRIARR